jgi:hypothetical protein
MAWPKVLNGRVATEADVEQGNVVFQIPEAHSTPYSFDQELPLTAKVIRRESEFLPPGSLVTIVQAERGDNGEVVLGLMLDDGGEAVCMLAKVEVVGSAPEDPPFSI